MSTQATRTITLYATKGGKKEKVETAVTTWKELKKIARDKGYDVDKLLSTENVTRHDLVNDEALLPEGPFTLFMRPKQVKSGAELSYKEIRAAIKADIEKHGDEAKYHYNVGGKNYTNKSTDELRALVASFTPSAQLKEETKESTAEVAETVTEEAVSDTPVKVVTNTDRVEKIKLLLIEIVENASTPDVEERATEILEDYLPGLTAEIEADLDATSTNVADVVESVKTAKEEPKESAEDKAKREQAEKEAAEKKAEEERIAAEKAEAIRLEKEEDERLAQEAKMYS